LIISRGKNWIESVVQSHEGEPNHGRGEPVEKVLKQLNGNSVGQVRFLVN